MRLPGYDYSQPGAYFVTLVAAGRQCLFGRVVDGEMVANAAGDLVRYEWEDLLRRFHFLQLGAFVVMPNHFHGILIIPPLVGATGGSPLRPHDPSPRSLGAMIAGFKSSVTQQINIARGTPNVPIWQCNYGACPAQRGTHPSLY